MLAYIVSDPICQLCFPFHLDRQKGIANSNQDAGVDCNGERVHIPCQDVKFYRSLGMIWVWQVFGGFQDFTSIAETTSQSRIYQT